jgi:Endonuclease/Exonuclease/phosphatase family
VDELNHYCLMRIAAWNLNNRVGKVGFRPEAADAAIALGADIVVLTEFYPQGHEQSFRRTLADAGYDHQLISVETEEVANRVLVAARVPIVPLQLELPAFDRQFPSNICGALVPSIGLSIVGVRVPAYKSDQAPFLVASWEWLETTAAKLNGSRALIVGDLNVTTRSSSSRGGDHFRRILASGWHRASTGESFFGRNGEATDIDHALATRCCIFSDAECIRSQPGFDLCGSPTAISDHAALICRIEWQIGTQAL